MKCPVCGGHLIQEGVQEAIDDYGKPRLDGSVDVQYAKCMFCGWETRDYKIVKQILKGR